MSVIVRAPSLTDAAGAGMASALIDRQRLTERVPDAYWQAHTEESAVAYWHDIFATRVQGRRIALGVTHRRVVGLCALAPTGRNDRSGQLAARPEEIFYFAALDDYAGPDLYQRLFDFCVPDLRPLQAWVWREDQAVRRFLRMNGFTLDGMSVRDANSGLDYSRMVR